MKKLVKGAWVLVADGKKALFLRNNGTTEDYDLRVVWHERQENPATREQGDDRPGRARGQPGRQGAALETTDWHQVAEDRFAIEIGDILNRAARDGAFSSVVIVAPPPVLSALRDRLTGQVAGLIEAEIAKTLTNHPVDKMAAILKSDLDAM